VQSNLDIPLRLKRFFWPKSNHWLRRILLVFTFILFDYFSTLVFCQAPHEEANLFARAFMNAFGIQTGLTLFVLATNLPIYMALSFDSHVIRLPARISIAVEISVDALFAWFIAGVHFNGGSSWFWYTPDLPRQMLGAFLYLIIAFFAIKPHKPRYDRQ